MIFSDNREDLRKLYQHCWQKHLAKTVLTDLEQQIVEVIIEHPEYQSTISKKQSLQQEWFPELGDTNPFLHLSLHLAIRDQLNTDLPQGIRDLVKSLLQKIAPHQLEHKLMDCLSEVISNNQQLMDTERYLECIRKIHLK